MSLQLIPSHFKVASTEEKKELSPLERIRDLAIKERRRLIKVVDDADDPIEQGRHLLSEIQKKREGKAPLQERGNSIDDLIRMGRSLKPYFDSVIQSVANATGGRAILPGLKKRKRIMEKVQADYKDVGYRGIKDIVRASLVFNHLEDLYIAVEQLYGLVKITFVEDRFVKPTDAGYSDMKLYIELPVPPEGKPFIAELQLHLSQMLEAKKEDTKLYMARRRLEAQLSNLPPDTDPLIKDKINQEIELYKTQGMDLYLKAAESYLVNSE